MTDYLDFGDLPPVGLPPLSDYPKYVDPAHHATLASFLTEFLYGDTLLADKPPSAPKKRIMTLVVPTELSRVSKNFILIQQSPSHKVHPGLLNFSGGKLKDNEPAPDCAVREFLEETGLCLRSPALAGVIAPSSHQPSDWMVMIYTGQAYFSIGAAQKIRAAHNQPLKTFYARASDMTGPQYVPNIPIIAALCAHNVGPFVLQDYPNQSSYNGAITLFRKTEPEDTAPRELPWGTQPPSH